jgi:hypothetical protein
MNKEMQQTIWVFKNDQSVNRVMEKIETKKRLRTKLR